MAQVEQMRKQLESAKKDFLHEVFELLEPFWAILSHFLPLKATEIGLFGFT